MNVLSSEGLIFILESEIFYLSLHTLERKKNYKNEEKHEKLIKSEENKVNVVD